MAFRYCSVCFDSGIEQTATASKLLVQNGITITFLMKIESSSEVCGLFLTAKLCAVATKGDGEDLWSLSSLLPVPAPDIGSFC